MFGHPGLAASANPAIPAYLSPNSAQSAILQAEALGAVP